jgi:hypothetical protein
MATDTFSTYSASLEGPADNIAAVTPSDSTDLATIPRALWIGAEGNVKVTAKGGGTETFVSVPVGWFPVRAVRVFATGTTATNIIAVW